MTHAEWVDEVDALGGGASLSPRTDAWLYREAYYDGYDAENACRIAMAPETTFTTGPGWCQPLAPVGTVAPSKSKVAKTGARTPVARGTA